jgi:predicted DsbA family dithiol-disulfide isomerase
MNIELWSDVVCPWCYIGRRRLERALAEVPEAASAEVVFRSFELDPEFPPGTSVSMETRLTEKYGMSPREAQAAIDRVTRVAGADGIDLRLASARPTNTLDAHRILQLASLRHRRPAVEERFQRAYFTEEALLSDPSTLLRLSRDAGLAESDVRRVLAGQAFTLQVRRDEERARELGATGVPFYLVDGTRPILGAQPVAVLVQALRGESAPRGPFDA